MIDHVIDIEILENAIIAFEEGASDEKRMALDSLRSLVTRKQTELNKFEDAMIEEEFSSLKRDLGKYIS